MARALYGHPFSSYTQKVLVALYENAAPFEFRLLGPDQPEHQAELARLSPMGKFPMLVDGARSFVEASVIIEYLQQVSPGPVRLIPDDPAAALEVRFLDRFFDLYVMDAMQVAVNAALKVVPMTPEDGLAHSRRGWSRPIAGWTGTWRGGPGPPGRPSRWRTAPRRRHCFMRTGFIRSRSSMARCGPIARGCWRGLHLHERWTRRDISGRTFRLGRRIGIEGWTAGAPLTTRLRL